MIRQGVCSRGAVEAMRKRKVAQEGIEEGGQEGRCSHFGHNHTKGLSGRSKPSGLAMELGIKTRPHLRAWALNRVGSAGSPKGQRERPVGRLEMVKERERSCTREGGKPRREERQRDRQQREIALWKVFFVLRVPRTHL